MTRWSGLAGAAATAARLKPLDAGAAWRGPAWSASRLGWGTLPGDLKNIVDSKLERACGLVLEHGANLLDSSPAYRRRRSQAALGRALARERARGLRREELVVVTHAGWLAFDRAEEEPAALLARESFPATGLTAADVLGQVWSLHPAWLRHQLELARTLTGLASFDLLLLDAPETGLAAWPRERWRDELRRAFAACEEWRAEGLIGGYGVASLEGFRADAAGRSRLDLDELLALAREAAGGEAAFAGLQLPFNLAALDLLNLRSGDTELRRRAADAGIWVGGLLSLGQGQLTRGLPAYFKEAMPGLTPVQQALQVLLSTEGLACALVGMKTREHIEENLALLRRPRLAPAAWQSLFRA